MADIPAHATVMVAQGSTAVTWEVAAIVAEALNWLGLSTRLGEPETGTGCTPIILFGQGAESAPPIFGDQARRAVVLLLAGPGTRTFDAAIGLAELAAGCFAVSPRTVALLNAQGIRADRFILGHTDRWDTRNAASESRSIDILHTGEVDEPGRRVLARIAPELAQLHSHIELSARRLDAPEAPATFPCSALLADATLTLSLNRWGDTTLDWATVVRAMCNGSVVIAERSTGYGEMVPGEHFLMTSPATMAPVIHASLTDPESVANIATTAYEFCSTELTMKDSLERLAVAAARSKVRRAKSHGHARPMATARSDSSRQRLEFKTVSLLADAPDADAEIDVICVEHRGNGPISLTRDSLAAQPARVNLHTGTIEITEHSRGSRQRQRPEPTGASVAEARNILVRSSSASLVMFIDAGDELLGDTLGQLVATLQRSAQSDISMPLVALGSDDVALPSLPGFSDGEGLRGYVVRRSYLQRTGPFVGDDGRTDGVDRVFWRRADAVGGRVALLPRVGVRLWQPTWAG